MIIQQNESPKPGMHRPRAARRERHGPRDAQPDDGAAGPVSEDAGPGPDTQVSGQSAGAAIGLTPDRSSRRTRIMTTVMINASSMIPAETMYPWENPCARA